MDAPDKPKHRLRQWVEKRWPVAPVIRWGSVDEIPGGTKFAYVLGSATLALFAVLVITGVWQLLYYVPTIDHAYDSVMFLRLQVPLGWLVHGLHYWAAQAFIVVMGLHMARVFICAAYKKPRELTWELGVVLLLLGASFIFTGAILPWDTMGYWAGEVGTSMAGTVPVIGTFLKLLMRGGDAMGQMTLSRAFVVHVAILPALTVFFIATHLVAFRQFGSVGPWNPKKQEKTGRFWPDQTFKDLLVVGLILVGLICLSAFVRAPISGPADPLDNSYTPKPEWNFLFLYEALKAFKGSWEWMGTTVIPMLLVLLLFAVPFIDRNDKRNPLRRPVAMVSGFMFVAVILVLTFIGHDSNSGANASSTAPPWTPPPQPASPRQNAPGFHECTCRDCYKSSCRTRRFRSQSGSTRDCTSGFHERTGTCLGCSSVDQSGCHPGCLRPQSSRKQAKRKSIANKFSRRQHFRINEPKPHLPSRCAADLRGKLRQMPHPTEQNLQLAGL